MYGYSVKALSSSNKNDFSELGTVVGSSIIFHAYEAKEEIKEIVNEFTKYRKARKIARLRELADRLESDFQVQLVRLGASIAEALCFFSH